MLKYQLTNGQKDILRAASKGLQEGTVKTEWTWYTMPSDTSGDETVLKNSAGFPQAEELGIKPADLTNFVLLGFLQVVEKHKHYDVLEQAIHDAVHNDFETPDPTVPSTTVQTTIHGNVIGSNINTAQYMDNISQMVQSSEFLSPDDKAEIQDKVAELKQELKNFEETYSREVREVLRSLDIVMGDLADDEPDKQNMTGSLERLRRAGEKLIFTPLAMKLVGEITDKISSLIPG